MRRSLGAPGLSWKVTPTGMVGDVGWAGGGRVSRATAGLGRGGSPFTEEGLGLLAQPAVLVGEPSDLGAQRVVAGLTGFVGGAQLGWKPGTGAGRPGLAESVDLG